MTVSDMQRTIELATALREATAALTRQLFATWKAACDTGSAADAEQALWTHGENVGSAVFEFDVELARQLSATTPQAES